MRLRKWLMAGAVLGMIVLSLAAAGTVLAFTNPHEGNFTLTTDACAGCHRAHTAVNDMLLKEDEEHLCISCHDGLGADTKVTAGVYLGTTRGTQNAGLRGGGFEQALMDTGLTGTPVTAPVTSRHSVGTPGTTAWGWLAKTGIAGPNPGTSVTLECASCHNPHGNGKYRLLRPQPTVFTSGNYTTSVNMTAGLSDPYTITYTAGDHYRDTGAYDVGVRTNVAEWCAQCHTQYSATYVEGHSGPGPGSSPSAGGAGNAALTYKHVTNGIDGDCLVCHVVHGTSATMGEYSGAVEWPGGAASVAWQGSESQTSRLLTVNNRGVCVQCHETFPN